MARCIQLCTLLTWLLARPAVRCRCCCLASHLLHEPAGRQLIQSYPLLQDCLAVALQGQDAAASYSYGSGITHHHLPGGQHHTSNVPQCCSSASAAGSCCALQVPWIQQRQHQPAYLPRSGPAAAAPCLFKLCCLTRLSASACSSAATLMRSAAAAARDLWGRAGVCHHQQCWLQLLMGTASILAMLMC